MTDAERKALVEQFVKRHRSQNPFRTADVHQDDCTCLRCAVDLLDFSGQRIAELERERAVVSDLLEQQKELALEYLFDCNRAGERIAELEARVAYLDGGARVGRFRITLPYGGAPDKIAIYDGPEGGDFDRDELEALIARFYEDRF